MSGYCSIGSVARPMKPRMTMSTEITVDSTGRFMKFVKVIGIYYLTIYYLTIYDFIASMKLEAVAWLLPSSVASLIFS